MAGTMEGFRVFYLPEPAKGNAFTKEIIRSSCRFQVLRNTSVISYIISLKGSLFSLVGR